MTLPETAQPLAANDALSEMLRVRLVGRIVKDNDIPEALAVRILDQAITFLHLCAADPYSAYAPSPMVDMGWHAFILYTREYAEFCQQIAGRFLHHSPTDEPGRGNNSGGVPRTVRALWDHGLPVDEDLWISSETECSVPCDARCHRTCEASPPPAPNLDPSGA
jgi:hypothetical protein